MLFRTVGCLLKRNLPLQLVPVASTSNPAYIVLKRPHKLKVRHVPQVKVPDVQELLASNEVLNIVNKQIAEKNYGRLFAVLQYGELQFKVTLNDIIVVEELQHYNVGNTIRLEKVLMVGGADFSLFGRPLVPRDSVTVEATVIEKTFSEVRVDWFHLPRKSCQLLNFIRKPLSFLRITKIDITSKMPLATEARNVWKEEDK